MRRLAALIALGLLAGCSPANDAASSPSPSAATQATQSETASPTHSPTPSPSPTVQPSFPSDMPTENAEEAAVIAGWQEYWRVYEKYAADPHGFTDFTETQLVTTGDEQVTILDTISYLREHNLLSLGGRVFQDVHVEFQKQSADKPNRASVTYCVDARNIKVVEEETGKPAERIGLVLEETATMEQGLDGIWRAAGFTNEKAECLSA